MGLVASAILLLVVALSVLGIALEVGGRNLQAGPRPNLLEDLVVLIAFLAFPAVGALIVAHHPGNVVGWMLLGIGVLVSVSLAGHEWARYGLVTREEPVPLTTLGAWVQMWTWYPVIGGIPTLLLLYFPNGKLLSPRWRPVAWVSIAMILAITIPSALEERLYARGYSIPNPVGIEGLRNIEDKFPFVLLLPPVAFSVTSLILRFLRSRGDERQQLKWIVFAAIALGVAMFVSEAAPVLEILFPVALLLLPVSMGVAVLKYRLYDIDVIINRALVYGLLTAVLGALYVGVVVLLGRALPIAEDSNISVAVSTLVIAALFRPLRSRVQQFIDHRFYRKKYDATRTVDSFAARLRQEVDLDQLTHELLTVVGDTMRPARVSLWLRPGGETPQDVARVS